MTRVKREDRSTQTVEQLAVDVAQRCSEMIGGPRWSNAWPCPKRYWATIRTINGFRMLVEDMEDSESDIHGYATFTTRHIKVFADDTLFVHAHKKVQGLDEYDGGGYGDSRVDQLIDVWHIARAPYDDEGNVRVLRKLSDKLGHESDGDGADGVQ